jgi:uncharacterized protein YjbJ (UPF0337 family)
MRMGAWGEVTGEMDKVIEGFRKKWWIDRTR